MIKWKWLVKFGEKKIDKQVLGHLLVGFFSIGWLMENKSSQSMIPKLCALASLSILQTSPNAGRFWGSHSQHLVMQKRNSSGQSLGKCGQNSLFSSILEWRFTLSSPSNGIVPVRISEHTIAKLQTSIFGSRFLERLFPCFDSRLNASGAAYTLVALLKVSDDEVCSCWKTSASQSLPILHAHNLQNYLPEVAQGCLKSSSLNGQSSLASCCGDNAWPLQLVALCQWPHAIEMVCPHFSLHFS